MKPLSPALLALAALAAQAATRSALPPAQEARPRELAAPPRIDSARIAEHFGARAWQPARIALELGVPPRLEVRLEAFGERLRLVLERHDLRSPDALVRVVGAGGSARAEPPPAPRTYRGRIEGRPEAVVLASLGEAGLSAEVLGDPRGDWSVRPLAELDARVARERHVVFRAADARRPELVCGVPGPAASASAAPLPSGPLRELDPLPLCLERCEIAFDADWEYYLAQGASVAATVARIDQHLNLVGGLVDPNGALCWTAGAGGGAHAVYLGSDPAAVAAATPASPEYLGATAAPSIVPGALAGGTTWFWRVDELVGGATVRGSLWQLALAERWRWRLDEAAGGVALESEVGLHGTYQNGVVLGVPGAAPFTGTAGRFDGLDDHALLPALASTRTRSRSAPGSAATARSRPSPASSSAAMAAPPPASTSARRTSCATTGTTTGRATSGPRGSSRPTAPGCSRRWWSSPTERRCGWGTAAC